MDGRDHPAATSLGHAARDALGDAVALARAELDLLRAELRGNVRAAGRGAALLAGAAVVALAVAVMVLVTIMAVLAALGLPAWAAALLSTLLGAALAGGLAFAGLKEIKRNAVPQRTVRELERDRDMVRERMK
ncbi:phage holin family protein [Jannaschia sp. LMIT008]|uniref:phage holin family protein n=1 Tax=Jannaschia maritima TaxID=3032585 RepID=UPI002810EE29|nr:phage holin family protein [Jannaschia sp. LMIT008]